MGNLSNLTNLSIEGNGLTGGIPPELGNLASLSELSLRGEGLRAYPITPAARKAIQGQVKCSIPR